MNEKVRKFLEFNGKKILFLGKNGIWWIAIRPICEALGVQYVRNFKNIKDDLILRPALSPQTMVAADGKLRKMSCLPEFFVYGWIMGIQSDAPGLAEYKWECYRILFEHFHGEITGRKELIKQKAANSFTIDSLKNKVYSTDEAIKLAEAERKQKAIDKNLRQLDHQQYDEELDLFKQNIENQPG